MEFWEMKTVKGRGYLSLFKNKTTETQGNLKT